MLSAAYKQNYFDGIGNTNITKGFKLDCCFVEKPLKYGNRQRHLKDKKKIGSDNSQEKEKLQLWNKSFKTPPFTTFNKDIDNLKQWKNENTLKTTDTLSLHMTVYENSVASDLFSDNDHFEGLKTKKFGTIKVSKQCFTETIKFGNFIEFPRQQNDKMPEPEVSQFKSSQQLIGSNRYLEELEFNGFTYVVGLTTQTRRPRLLIYYKEGDKDSCVCYYVHNDDTARCIGCLNYIKYDKVRKVFLTNPAEGHGNVVTKEGKCYFDSNEINDKQFQLVFLAKCEGEGVQNLEVFKANFKNSYETIFGKMTAKVRDSMRKRIERALAEKVANNSINEIDDVFRFPSLFPAPGEVVVNDEAVFNEIDNGGEVVVNDEAVFNEIDNGGEVVVNDEAVFNEIDNGGEFVVPGKETAVSAENVEVAEADAIPPNNDKNDERENDIERAECEANKIEQSMIDLSLRENDFDAPGTPPQISTLPTQPEEVFKTPRQNYIKKRRHQVDSVVGRLQDAKNNLEKLAGHTITKKDFLEKKMLKRIGKEIGSGAYGKVYEALMNDGQKVALKVIILTKQREYELASFEINMMKRLKALRSENMTNLVDVGVVKGPFPQSSKVPEENEMHKAVFMIQMGGKQLEEYLITSPEEFLSIFSQICSFMATGEQILELEHRDAHISNILIEKTAKEEIGYVLNSKKYFVKSNNILVKLIDFGQSRIRDEHGILFGDIKNDSDLFGQALRGDPEEHDLHQTVYDKMENANGKDWSKFTPATNVLWLNYLVQKLTGFDEKGIPSIFPPTEAVQAAMKEGKENPLPENVRKQYAAEIFGTMKNSNSAIEIFFKLFESELFKDVLKQS